ncbi:MAG: DUF1772 domain-containing protein [Acidimicrobiales bacterium]
MSGPIGSPWLDGAVTAAAVGSAVIGGVLFGFSSFIMSALDRLPPDRSIEAMQSINRQAPTAAFGSVMFGTAAVAVVVGVAGARRLDTGAGRMLILGAVSYLAAVVITGVFHVPRNDRLATVVTPAADTARTWSDYAGPWTAGNHLRAALAILAAVLFTVAGQFYGGSNT